MLRNLFNEGAFIFGGRVLGVGVTFFYTAVITKSLGASQAGLFFLGQTIILILSLVSRLGFDNLMVKKMAIHSIGEDKDEIWSLLLKVITLVAITSICIVLLLNFLSSSLESVFAISGLQVTISIMSISIPMMALLYIVSESLKGLFFTVWATFTQSLLLPITFSLILYWLIKGLTIENVLWGYVFATIISLFVVGCIWLFKIGLPDSKFLNAFPETSGHLLGESLPLLWAGAAGLIFSWTDTLVLGAVQNSKEVGLYVVASRSSQVIALILMVANTLLGPRFARLYNDAHIERLKNLFFKTAIFMFVAGLIAIIPFLFFPKEILVLFGEEFIVAVNALTILVFGQFVNVASGAGGILLVMAGKAKIIKVIMILTSLFNLFLSYLLGVSFGAVGVAVATAISMALMNVLIFSHVLKFFKITSYEG